VHSAEGLLREEEEVDVEESRVKDTEYAQGLLTPMPFNTFKERWLKVSENDPKTITWPAWRITRLLKMLEYKSQGLTDAQVAAKDDMPSEKTVSRELNSNQSRQIGEDMIKRATGMIWPILERQIKQIETDLDLQAPQRITYRGKLLSLLINLVPHRMEANITGSGVAPVIISFHPDTAIKLNKEEEEEPEEE